MSVRLADAIRLGSLLIEHPAPHNIKSCALGMASLSLFGRIEGSTYFVIYQIHRKYPWTTTIVPCPCCGISGRVTRAIYHLFDTRVAPNRGTKTMTIEQLCDWVDSIDPTPRDRIEDLLDAIVGEHDEANATETPIYPDAGADSGKTSYGSSPDEVEYLEGDPWQPVKVGGK